MDSVKATGMNWLPVAAVGTYSCMPVTLTFEVSPVNRNTAQALVVPAHWEFTPLTASNTMARLAASQSVSRTSLNILPGLPTEVWPLFSKVAAWITLMPPTYSTFQFVKVMLLLFASTKAGMN